jgi:predicted nucleotidyltransferase
LEKQEGVKILFAVESGSREWGFSSGDSDYDVRCVHVSKKESYLSLKDVKEQIDLIEGDIDIVSWDIKKFFKLFLNSNPTVSEWLSSKIVYLDNGFAGFYQKDLAEIFKKGFNREKLKKHYLSLAAQNYKKYIDVSAGEVSLKKYVYILRALGCVEYLNRIDGLPPLNWEKSSVYLSDQILKSFSDFVDMKKNSEKAMGKRVLSVDRFVEDKLGENVSKGEEHFDFEKINNIVIKTILAN